MDMLLGFVRIVPFDLGLEAAGLRIEFHGGKIGPHDAFERVHDRAGAQSIEWIGPVGAIAQADGVVIAVREAKPHEKAARGFGPEGVDQLFSQQAHRGRTEDDDSLLVQPDNTFIRPKIEQFDELQATVIHRSTIQPPKDGVQWRHAANGSLERSLVSTCSRQVSHWCSAASMPRRHFRASMDTDRAR
jgi:hypothetical protein